MSALDKDKITKLKRGELLGTVSTALCAAAVAYFVIMFVFARVNNSAVLEITAWATGPVLLVLFIACAAFCNLKFGSAIEKEINKYVQDVLVENAPYMHPERDSLSFFITTMDLGAEVTVNGYKEKIIFDFSAFGKLSAVRKISIANAIADKIAFTFCKLYERGGGYKSVNYSVNDLSRSKKGKTVPIIEGGVPDKKTFKRYLKNT